MIVIQEFLRRHNLFENAIITYPDPPDCVFQNGESKGWIEVTAAFRLWKKFTPDKNQKKVFGAYEYECPPNEDEYITEVIKIIIKGIIEKDLNQNYEKQKHEFGLGILLIHVNDACFRWQDHLEKIINQDNYKHLSLSNFKSVYIYSRPITVEQISSNPSVWVPKVLASCDDFHLILKNNNTSTE